MNKNRITIAGSILLDVVKRVERYPEKGTCARVLSLERAVGGCVCNTGIDLKRLDKNIHVTALGRVGQDENGTYLLDKMSAEGLDVSGVKRYSTPTSYSDVVTEITTGERTFFALTGANGEFNEEDIDVFSLDCDIFHLGYLFLLDALDETDEEYGTKAARLLSRVSDRGIKTSIDIITEESDRFAGIVTPALKYCDYVVINEVEAGMLCGISATDDEGRASVARLEAICRNILALGVRECVVIHCPELSCAMEKDGRFTVLPSLNLPAGYIVGAVGAGDAFCAGMLYSFLKGYDTEYGMRLASCVAACNLAVSDSVSGAKSAEESLELEKKFGRRKLC